MRKIVVQAVIIVCCAVTFFATVQLPWEYGHGSLVQVFAQDAVLRTDTKGVAGNAPGVSQARNAVAISKDGVLIAYSVYGQGEPTLVFVHGWSCDRSFWQKQIPYFANRYRVVTLDLAGHGASGTQRNVYSMEAFGQDVAAVVKAVQATRAILIGHSMGGAVIIAAGEIIPENASALVGIDTMQDFAEEYTPAQTEEFLKPFRDDFQKATDGFVRNMFLKDADPQLVNDIVAKMSGASAEVGISAMEEMLKASYVKAPPKITMPIWCLNAELWPTKPEVNRKFVPEFNLRLMPGVGHFLMLESPDEFNKQLDEILKEIVARK